MLEGLDTGLAILLITWGPALVGFIPVLIGWNRIASSTIQSAFPKALWALTASICVGPIGFAVFLIIWIGVRSVKPFYTLPPQLFVALLAVGFVLSVIALAIAACAKNAARAAILVGSIVVAAVNTAGFAWLLSTSRGISMWVN